MSPMDEDESAALGAHPRASAEQGSANVCWGHGRTLSGAGGCSSTGLPGCVSPVLTNTADTNGSRQADSSRQAPTLRAQGCCQHETGCSQPSQQHRTACCCLHCSAASWRDRSVVLLGGLTPILPPRNGALLTLQLMSRGCEVCLPRCIGDAHCQGVGMPCHALPCMGVLLLRDPPAPPQGSGGEDGLDAWEYLEEAPATACVSEWKFHASALGVVRPATVGGRCWQWRVV